jgi:hypothetical protein
MGTLVSALGVYLSLQLDLPTGAAIVCTFGLVLILMALAAYSSVGVFPAALRRHRNCAGRKRESGHKPPGVARITAGQGSGMPGPFPDYGRAVVKAIFSRRIIAVCPGVCRR